MFSKEQRIKRFEIEQISKKPDFVLKSPIFIVKGSKNNLDKTRFCIILSKNTEKVAAKRHFLKRKLINILKSINLNNNFDLIFYVKKDTINKNEEQIKRDLVILLNKCIID